MVPTMRTALILAMLALSACAQQPQGQSFCSAAQPIYFDKADKLSKATERRILALNETGRVLCGWQPPAKGP